jgi:hypothetical protein
MNLERQLDDMKPSPDENRSSVLPDVAEGTKEVVPAQHRWGVIAPLALVDPAHFVRPAVSPVKAITFGPHRPLPTPQALESDGDPIERASAQGTWRVRHGRTRLVQRPCAILAADFHRLPPDRHTDNGSVDLAITRCTGFVTHDLSPQVNARVGIVPVIAEDRYQDL